MKKKITVGNLVFLWNGLFYEMKENDPVKRLFLDIRHKQALIQVNRDFIDMN